ncbi:hypothetical protein TKK_0014660 [Trichogramma kaykai]
MILECMSVLCHARSFAELDVLFRHVCTVFLSKTKDVAQKSIKIISDTLKQDDYLTKELKYVQKDGVVKDEKLSATNISDQETSAAMFRKSPFYTKYNKILVLLEAELEEIENEDESEQNVFHAPLFVEHTVTMWMPYVVLWSALDLDLIDPDVSRLSNAYVETYH